MCALRSVDRAGISAAVSLAGTIAMLRASAKSPRQMAVRPHLNVQAQAISIALAVVGPHRDAHTGNGATVDSQWQPKTWQDSGDTGVKTESKRR